ncbi:Elongin-C [Aphelenchoides besseyi]|nr:Elongin-C [Aphelenchoides besseyi]KAI6211331.1 Elongin-C [Aphelenchoides besseyi]
MKPKSSNLTANFQQIGVRDDSAIVGTSEERYSFIGPNSSHVKLVSMNGHVFYIRRQFTAASSTLTNMINGVMPIEEDEKNEIRFPEMTAETLKRVCHYLAYRDKYQNYIGDIPEFLIEPEMSADLLYAAIFMDC